MQCHVGHPSRGLIAGELGLIAGELARNIEPRHDVPGSPPPPQMHSASAELPPQERDTCWLRKPHRSAPQGGRGAGVVTAQRKGSVTLSREAVAQ